ncbi:MAG: hypothetical protein NVSMB4_12200 [Acidimicrobiales bacterium]
MTPGGILRTLRENAGLTQGEIAKRAGTSQPAVARYEAGDVSPSVRTLERLVHATGNRLRMTVEPASSASDLSGPRMAKLLENRTAILLAARRLGVRNVRVFGSVARGEDGPDSDVDLLVDVDLARAGVLPLIRLRRDLAELLHEEVDVVTEELLQENIARHAADEAVPL